MELNGVASSARRIVVPSWALGILCLMVLAWLVVLDGRMRAGGQPGLLEFEFAGSGDRAREILAGWDSRSERAAELAQWVDYAFALLYAALLAAASRSLGRRAMASGRFALARAASAVALAIWLAALSDAVQNAALLLVLARRNVEPAAAVASVCGVATSIGLVGAIAFLVAGNIRVRDER